MFSNTEYQYIRDLTYSFYNQGYVNYMCYTNNPSNSYNTQYYDIFCYYSINTITQNYLSFSFGNDTKKCSIDSKLATSSYKNNSLLCSDSNNTSISVDSKEFIYSNVGYNSDILAEYQNTKIFNKSNLLSLNAVIMILVIIFLYEFTIKLFRK